MGSTNTDQVVLDPDGDLTRIIPRKRDTNPFAFSQPNSNGKRPDLRMLVSSKHLALISPVFKTMLYGPFAEAQTLRDTGRLDLPLPEDDAEAMKLLMRIAHFHLEDVPTVLPAGDLFDVAVLVDKYKLHKIVGHVVSNWLEPLEALPLVYLTGTKEEMLRRLAIAWVFGRGDDFRRLTDWAQKNISESLVDDVHEDNPLPGPIIEKILESRYGLFTRALETIDSTIQTFTETSVCKNERCCAILLGSTIRQAKKDDLLSGSVDEYSEWPFADLHDRVMRWEPVVQCPIVGMRVPPLCIIRFSIVRNSISNLFTRDVGLKLEDFPLSGDRRPSSKPAPSFPTTSGSSSGFSPRPMPSKPRRS